MKTAINLDYQAILANQPQPIHFALLFEAPESTTTRPQPAAFTIVLDRSTSMTGAPIDAARQAAKDVVKNLRKTDLFSLVVFDNESRTIIPLAKVKDRKEAAAAIDAIHVQGCTNLTGGWMLGRDELKKVPTGTLRRLLLLSDGLLNQGITEPDQVTGIVGNGLELDRIRTSALGFGSGYDEDLLARLARVTNGEFYDANSPEKLPAIFEAELDGLQKTVIINLRVRMKTLDFVEGIQFLRGTEPVTLPDGRLEFAQGDLVADETLAAVFKLDVLAIPDLAPGRPAATLEGERLVEVEILYDRVEKDGVVSVSETHAIRVRPTQDPGDIRVNETALPWVTPPQAARIVEEAVRLRDAGSVEEAKQALTAGIKRMEAYGRPDETRDALDLLNRTLEQIGDPQLFMESRKAMRYSSSAYLAMRSAPHWSSDVAEPEFRRRPSRSKSKGSGETSGSGGKDSA